MRQTNAQRRRAREARQGVAMIAFAALAFAGMIGGAAMVDNAQGLTVSQSLAAWGI
jgi:Flp pilus assembly protein TadG